MVRPSGASAGCPSQVSRAAEVPPVRLPDAVTCQVNAVSLEELSGKILSSTTVRARPPGAKPRAYEGAMQPGQLAASPAGARTPPGYRACAASPERLAVRAGRPGLSSRYTSTVPAVVTPTSRSPCGENARAWK